MYLFSIVLVVVQTIYLLAQEEEYKEYSLEESNNNSSVNATIELERAKKFLKELNENKSETMNLVTKAQWNYESNLTSENNRIYLDALAQAEEIDIAYWNELVKFTWNNLRDKGVQRQFNKLVLLGSAALVPEKRKKYPLIVSNMSDIYGKAKICVAKKCDLPLEPDVTKIMATERDYDVLKEAWVNWRNATGKKMRKMYSEYVDLANSLAISNSFGSTAFFLNYGDYWRHPYEDNSFRQLVEKLWGELRELYTELHAYVRMKLRKKYGDKMPKDGTIPAHLLGNMWAQQWNNIYNEVIPYPNITETDVTTEMVKQGYDAMKMFKLSEDFFVDLGLENMTEEFWNNSIFVKPENRELICHASAWDFYDGSDFRIKMCTVVTLEDLTTIHHEMGHIQYFQLYKDQPQVFRDGANPGFHEALGDVMELSVTTPKHLKKIGLLKSVDESEEGMINAQMKQALKKIVFLPFGYLIDLWRWDVFENKTKADHYNKKWWELRLSYQGVSPPVKRYEDDFDPGCKYHIPADVPYISYFVSYIIQFQFHKSFCELASQRVLHDCDIDGNKNVGAKIKEYFKQGSSIPWQKQLKQLTGLAEMSSGPLLEYFKPLREFLKKELAAANEKPGWNANIDDYVEDGQDPNFASTLNVSLFAVITCFCLFYFVY